MQLDKVQLGGFSTRGTTTENPSMPTRYNYVNDSLLLLWLSKRLTSLTSHVSLVQQWSTDNFWALWQTTEPRWSFRVTPKISFTGRSIQGIYIWIINVISRRAKTPKVFIRPSRTKAGWTGSGLVKWTQFMTMTQWAADFRVVGNRTEDRSVLWLLAYLRYLFQLLWAHIE